jgi:hypothetical protein
LDFKFFFPCLEHENSVPTPFWNLSLGFMFKALSLVCVNNTVIVHSTSVAMSESTVNYCSSILATVRNQHVCNLTQSPWQEPFI